MKYGIAVGLAVAFYAGCGEEKALKANKDREESVKPENEIDEPKDEGTERVNVLDQLPGVEPEELYPKAAKVKKTVALQQTVEKMVAQCREEVEEILKELDGELEDKCTTKIPIKGEKEKVVFSKGTQVLPSTGTSVVGFNGGNIEEFCLSQFMTKSTGEVDGVKFWNYVPIKNIKTDPCRRLVYAFSPGDAEKPVFPENEAVMWENKEPQTFEKLVTVLRIIQSFHERGVSGKLKVSGIGSGLTVKPESFAWMSEERQRVTDMQLKGGLEVILNFVGLHAFPGDESGTLLAQEHVVRKDEPLIQFLDEIERFDYLGGEAVFDFEKWINIFSLLAQRKKTPKIDPISTLELADPKTALDWWTDIERCFTERKQLLKSNGCINLDAHCGVGKQVNTKDVEGAIKIKKLVSAGLYTTSREGVMLKLVSGTTGSDCMPFVYAHCSEQATLSVLEGLDGKCPRILPLDLPDGPSTDCDFFSMLVTRVDGEKASTWLNKNAETPVKIISYLVHALETLSKLHCLGLAHNGVHGDTIFVDNKFVRLEGFERARPMIGKSKKANVWDNILAPMKKDVRDLLNSVKEIMADVVENSKSARLLYREIAKLGMLDMPNYANLAALLRAIPKELKEVN